MQVSSGPDQSGLVPLGQWHGLPACERLVVELSRACTPRSLYSLLSVLPAELLRSLLAMFSPYPVPGVLVVCARDPLNPWPGRRRFSRPSGCHNGVVVRRQRAVL